MKDKGISFQILRIEEPISKPARPCLEEVCVNGMFIHLAKSALGVPGIWSQHPSQRHTVLSTPTAETLAYALTAVPMGLNPCARHQEELLEGLPLMGWWVWDAPKSQGEASEGPACLGGLDGVGEAGSMGSSSVQPISLSAFAFPLISRKFPFISTQPFWSIDFFLRSILLLPWVINHRHLGVDEGSNSVCNSHHFS